jgi:hypothetical protein
MAALVEAVGQHITLLIPPDRLDEENTVLASRAGRRIEHFETVRVTKDGRQVSVSITMSPGTLARQASHSSCADQVSD